MKLKKDFNAGNEIWGVLKFQYEPRDRILKKNLSKDALKAYLRSSKLKKIILIDKLQSAGYFG